MDGISGEMINCRLSGSIGIEAGKRLSGVEMVIEGDTTTIDMQSTSGTEFSCDVNSGYLLFKNAVPGSLIELNIKGGEVELDPSITGGDLYLEGVGNLFGDPSALGMNVKANHLLALETIPGPVWDEQLSLHQITGSSGKALSLASSGGVDYSVLAQAVWNELLAGHVTNDTAGFIMKQIAMLADELHKIQGLSNGNPMTVTPTSRTAGAVILDITGDGKTTTTVTRQ
jgi:hypothetical protein